MMQIQSNMYEPTSFMDGTPMPRTVLMMVASECISSGKGEGKQKCESVRARQAQTLKEMRACDRRARREET
jgi:hypothetical protein